MLGAGNLGIEDEGPELLGGFGSFAKRMGRKATNVVKDVARPVTAAATGDFKSAGRALWHGAIAAPVTMFKVGQQVSEGKAPDIEAARDVGLRQADNLVGDFKDQIIRAIKAAIRPVVSGFVHGEDILLGEDSPDLEAQAKETAKTQATIAAMPIAASAGGAAGSAIPGVGTAAGAALASTVTPSLVSEIIDELWSKGKNALTSSGSTATTPATQATKSRNQAIVIVGVGALALWALSKKGRKA